MLHRKFPVHNCVAALVSAALVMLGTRVEAGQGPIIVFAAASLTNAMQDIGNAYALKNGQKVVFSFASSALMAKQIELGGGADVFFSADTEWMDYLDRKGLLAPGTRHNLLGNRLVLIAPAGLHTRLKLENGFLLAKALGSGRLALADPDSVPAGQYARAALTALGVWDSVSGQLAPAENVRMALAYVARGEAPLGVVYDTDARIEPKVRIVGVFPEDTHPAILYPVALTKDAKADATAFLAYLDGAAARAAFEKYGFKVLN